MTANRGCRPRVASPPSRPPPNRRNSQNASASSPSTTITNKTTVRPFCPSPNNVSITPPRTHGMPPLNADRSCLYHARSADGDLRSTDLTLGRHVGGADSDGIAQRLAVAEHEIKPALGRADHDRARLL